MKAILPSASASKRVRGKFMFPSIRPGQNDIRASFRNNARLRPPLVSTESARRSTGLSSNCVADHLGIDGVAGMSLNAAE